MRAQKLVLNDSVFNLQRKNMSLGNQGKPQKF